jgi:hypothetical protein
VVRFQGTGEPEVKREKESSSHWRALADGDSESFGGDKVSAGIVCCQEYQRRAADFSGKSPAVPKMKRREPLLHARELA